MANLIITIIGIGLVAVAAIMGAYYGGTAFLNNTAQVHANTFLNEVHQIYAAATEYGLDHGLSNFGSDFSIESVYGGSYLPERPPIAGQATYNAGANDASSCAPSSTVSTLDGEPVFMARGIYQSNGKNVVEIFLADLTGGAETACGAITAWGADLSAAGSASLPLVKMVLAINKTMGLPGGLTLAASGIPYAKDGNQASGIAYPGGGGWYGSIYFDGSDKFNYCYLGATSGSIPYMFCVFTS